MKVNDLKKACWKGYTAVGLKNKGGKKVPNCVPVKEDGAAGMGGAPANNAGGGNIAGIGIGKQGEPGVSPKKKKAVMPFRTFTRKPPK